MWVSGVGKRRENFLDDGKAHPVPKRNRESPFNERGRNRFPVSRDEGTRKANRKCYFGENRGIKTNRCRGNPNEN